MVQLIKQRYTSKKIKNVRGNNLQTRQESTIRLCNLPPICALQMRNIIITYPFFKQTVRCILPHSILLCLLICLEKAPFLKMNWDSYCARSMKVCSLNKLKLKTKII